MARGKKSTEKPNKANDTGANLGFEAKLWAAAGKQRTSQTAFEEKHT